MKGMRGANRYYYTADSLGSITGVLDQAGALIESNKYRAFGENVLSSPTLNQPFGYTGREYDSETGLYYYRARYYEPKFGRFISEDPIRFAGGMNFYAYVANNPTTYIDPYGLDWLKRLAEVSAGGGDAFTFGLTRRVRQSLGTLLVGGCDPTDESSGWYKAGEIGGTALQIAVGSGIPFSAGGTATFYSGGSGAALQAARAQKTGKLLGETLGGRALNAAEGVLKNRFNRELPEWVWKGASGIFATANVGGRVEVFLRGTVAQQSIWMTVERPILQLFRATVTFR